MFTNHKLHDIASSIYTLISSSLPDIYPTLVGLFRGKKRIYGNGAIRCANGYLTRLVQQ